MRKARNNKNIENIENIESVDNIELVEDIDASTDEDAFDENEIIEEDNEATLKEWDIADDDEIHEFLSRDLDVVTRTRQRLREKQEAKERLAEAKKSKQEKVKPEKSRTQKAKQENEKSENKPLEGVILFFKNAWTKWMELYHKYTMQILYGVLGVLAIILLIAIVATNMGGAKPVDTEAQTTSKEEESESVEEPSSEPEEETLVAESKDSEVHKIVASYFDALYVQANIDEVGKYVDDVTNFNADRLTSYDKYYEAVDNIQCYKFETARVENSYVVFVTYGLKLYNIETYVPSGEALVVKQDAEGKYLVHNLTDKEILDLKISNEDYVKHISELEQQVKTAFEQVLETDSEFKEVYDMMQGLANKATEQESNSQTNTGSATQESTTPAQ